jgi:hypothetical protein
LIGVERPMPMGQKDDPNDPRAKVLQRFRNFAIFWIAILVAYFVGADAFLGATGTPTGSALPILLLLFGCVIIGAVWHAAAIVAMTAARQLDER